MATRKPFDLQTYVADIATRPCFICSLIEGAPEAFHHVVSRDEEAIIFLSKFPTLPGYCLLSPIQHIEDIADGLSSDAYLRMQAKVHRLSRALKRVFGAERIYVLSLGSQQGNRHLHFHVVPLPPGVPLEKQQYHALMAENGVLEFTFEEMADMAEAIRSAYDVLA